MGICKNCVESGQITCCQRVPGMFTLTQLLNRTYNIGYTIVFDFILGKRVIESLDSEGDSELEEVYERVKGHVQEAIVQPLILQRYNKPVNQDLLLLFGLAPISSKDMMGFRPVIPLSYYPCSCLTKDGCMFLTDMRPKECLDLKPNKSFVCSNDRKTVYDYLVTFDSIQDFLTEEFIKWLIKVLSSVISETEDPCYKEDVDYAKLISIKYNWVYEDLKILNSILQYDWMNIRSTIFKQ